MYTQLQRLQFWCQKVIPLVYDDSLSYYELLCKVVKYINDMINNQNSMNDILQQYGQDIKQLKEDINYLESELEKVKNGDYTSMYIDSLSAWIDKNLQELVSKIVKYVFFELDDSGYFIAYIPQTWEFLSFNTIMDYDNPNYGHLTLEW